MMNLKKRLRKLEAEIINDSEFCQCLNTLKHEIIFQKDDVQTVQKAIPSGCDKCGKPIEKQIIVVNFVKPRNQSLN